MTGSSNGLVESDYGEDTVLVRTWWLWLCPNAGRACMNGAAALRVAGVLDRIQPLPRASDMPKEHWNKLVLTFVWALSDHPSYILIVSNTL